MLYVKLALALAALLAVAAVSNLGADAPEADRACGPSAGCCSASVRSEMPKTEDEFKKKLTPEQYSVCRLRRAAVQF